MSSFSSARSLCWSGLICAFWASYTPSVNTASCLAYSRRIGQGMRLVQIPLSQYSSLMTSTLAPRWYVAALSLSEGYRFCCRRMTNSASWASYSLLWSSLRPAFCSQCRSNLKLNPTIRSASSISFWIASMSAGLIRAAPARPPGRITAFAAYDIQTRKLFRSKGLPLLLMDVSVSRARTFVCYSPLFGFGTTRKNSGAR